MAELSIEEMYGTQAAKPAKPAAAPAGTTLSVQDLYGAGAEGPEPEGFELPKPAKDFLATTGKTFEELKDLALHGTLRQRFEANIGLVKSVAGGMVDLGETALQGVWGLVRAHGVSRLGPEAMSRQYEIGSREGMAAGQAANEIATRLTNVNMAPKGKEQEAMGKLLAIIPEGIKASGESVYDKTGSALAGAGTEALLTLVSLKPGIVAKVIKAPIPKGKSPLNPKVETTFEKLAATQPDKARALSDHVGEVDPKLKQYLDEKIKQFETASEKELELAGERQAQYTYKEPPREVPEQQSLLLEREPEQLGLPMKEREQPVSQLDLIAEMEQKLKHEVDQTGEHRITTPNGELILQEGTNALQVRRIDVAERARGKGEGQAMLRRAVEEADKLGVPLMSDVSVSPAAEKLYKALKDQGYEVKKNPAVRSKTTGNLVSQDPRRGVFQVRPKPREMKQISIEEMYSPPGEQLGLNLEQPPAQMQLALPEQLAGGIRDTIREAHEDLNRIQIENRQTPPSGPRTVTIAQGKGKPPVATRPVARPVSQSSAAAPAVKKAFNITEKVPALAIAKGKLQEYYRQLIMTFNPEALGPQAKKGAAILASKMAEQMRKDSFFNHRSRARQRFWNQNLKLAAEFISKFEKGEKFSDPELNKIAEAYRQWNREIAQKEMGLGIEYQPIDNYLYHTFVDSKGVADFLTRRYGTKWNNPGFIKERSFDLYEEALAANFKPRYTNPEDIMLARQHASDVAEMQVLTLRDMEKYGLAERVKGESIPDWPAAQRRAPNGERFWVHEQAASVVHNAFDTQSLWTLRGLGGDVYRGAMELKNAIVPVKLALSLFHPLHVLTIHNATGMVRATKALLAKSESPATWMKKMAAAGIYRGFLDDPRTGSRILRAYRGQLKEGELTSADTQALQFMQEGGFTPEMPAQYRLSATRKFVDAIDKRKVTAIWHAPFAAMGMLQKPLFEHWIPSLKVASYLKDVQTALKLDPTLMEKPLERMELFRKLAKSVDNRYGEMAYSTLFWNRWVKDLAVLNTLSLGWQLGFLREYGGGALDLGQWKGGVRQKVLRGELDRPLFVTFYTAQALAYGGLLTWALSGEAPSEPLDYTYPKSGDVDANGVAKRVTTMFYPREFTAIYKHMQHEGVLPGLGHTVSNKASGLIGLAREAATGLNGFGQEIRDPEAPAYKQLQQTLVATLGELEPISVGEIRQRAEERTVKSTALSVSGFGQAPKYITESTTEAHIKQAYQKFVAPKATPYDKAIFSNEMRELRRFEEAGADDKYQDKLEEMIDKFELQPKDIIRIRRQALRPVPGSVAMFQRLPWQTQKQMLDKMTDDEREVYLPVSNKDHLRQRYESPEER